MPFYLKSQGHYVYVKVLGAGDTINGAEPDDDTVKAALTFDAEGNEKGEFEFIEYPQELNWMQSSDNRHPQLRETNTGWFAAIHTNWRAILSERTGFHGFVDDPNKPGWIRTARGAHLGDEPYIHMLPTGNPGGDGGSTIGTGRCLLEGIVRLVLEGDWWYERCADMRWEYEDVPDTPSPNPSPSPNGSDDDDSSFPIWNPLDSEFWDVENYAMWIYVGILLVALSGMAVAAYLATTRAP